jgi:ABC-type nitrate/sulfonate/bicarbonate transport system substrate-binding protein
MQIKVGGVPEHFNFPWHIAHKEGSFQNIGIDLIWEDVPGGTGAMCQALREGSLDMAVVLTEGIVADIIKGNPSMIVQKFVKSPLVWGIHAGPKSDLNYLADWSKIRFAISRPGSGSHIMAHVEANNRGIKLRPDQFVEVGGLTGAVEAISHGKADVLLWEKFSTMPLVEQGVFVRVGECITPWPCFCIAARDELLVKHPEKVWNMLWLIRKISRHFMHDEQSPEVISKYYNLDPDQTRIWFNQTEWEQDIYISQKMLNNVMNTLLAVGVIDEKKSIEHLCWNRTIVY